MRRADVAGEVYPAVQLDLAVFDLLSTRSFVNGLHQRIRGELARIANVRCSVDLPIARRERRRIKWRRRDATRVRRVGIGWRIRRRAQLLEKCFVQSLEKWFV